MKWKLFVLLFLFFGFIGGCATVPRTHESLMQNPVYRSATPDNRESILARKMGVGMSIAECQLAWAKTGFRLLRKDSLGDEVWRVPPYGVDSYGVIYLHVRNGRVIYMDEYPDR